MLSNGRALLYTVGHTDIVSVCNLYHPKSKNVLSPNGNIMQKAAFLGGLCTIQLPVCSDSHFQLCILSEIFTGGDMVLISSPEWGKTFHWQYKPNAWLVLDNLECKNLGSSFVPGMYRLAGLWLSFHCYYGLGKGPGSLPACRWVPPAGTPHWTTAKWEHWLCLHKVIYASHLPVDSSQMQMF